MRYKMVKSGTSEKYNLDGGELTSILATKKDTDGKVSIFDSKLLKGYGAPWHFHELDDEIFYIISGKIKFNVENESFVGTVGDLIIAGPNVKRKFKALENSHLLVINAIAGPSEGFIRELANFSDDNPISISQREKFIKEYKIHIV